jgi:hypothetical protein
VQHHQALAQPHTLLKGIICEAELRQVQLAQMLHQAKGLKVPARFAAACD